MSLKDILREDLGIVPQSVCEDVPPEKIREDLPLLQDLIAYWRVYPDKFVDYLCSLNPNNSFKFYYYQRVNQ